MQALQQLVAAMESLTQAPFIGESFSVPLFPYLVLHALPSYSLSDPEAP